MSAASALPSRQIEETIIELIRLLPYAAFLDIVAIVLEKEGYRDVTVLRRGSDRNENGGIDFAAVADAGRVRVAAIAQAKQYGEPVQKRYVDEIRGAAVRTGAHHALIFSTSPFSESARVAGNGEAVPVSLVDGDELAALMTWHRIGVVRAKDGLRIDSGFFEGLAIRHKTEQNRADSRGSGKSKPSLTLSLWFGERTSSSGSRRCGS